MKMTLKMSKLPSPEIMKVLEEIGIIHEQSGNQHGTYHKFFMYDTESNQYHDSYVEVTELIYKLIEVIKNE